MKGLPLPFTAERQPRLVWLPAILIAKVDSGGHHVIANDSRQLGDQILPVNRRAGLDHQLVDSATVLHDPTVLDIAMVDNFVTFLGRGHGNGWETDPIADG